MDYPHFSRQVLNTLRNIPNRCPFKCSPVSCPVFQVLPPYRFSGMPPAPTVSRLQLCNFLCHRKRSSRVQWRVEICLRFFAQNMPGGRLKSVYYSGRALQPVPQWSPLNRLFQGYTAWPCAAQETLIRSFLRSKHMSASVLLCFTLNITDAALACMRPVVSASSNQARCISFSDELCQLMLLISNCITIK